MSMKISNLGANVNLNNNQQQKNIAFGTAIIFDDRLIQRQLKSGAKGVIRTNGLASKIKPIELKTYFSTMTLDKLKAELSTIFKKNGDNNIVKISLKSIHYPENKEMETMSCAMELIGNEGKKKTQKFIALPPQFNGEKSSLFSNASEVYESLKKL